MQVRYYRIFAYIDNVFPIAYVSTLIAICASGIMSLISTYLTRHVCIQKIELLKGIAFVAFIQQHLPFYNFTM